jgi:glycosyltransferase involved in cell wall biosynthesis
MIHFSLGIMAWNEADCIRQGLESLFKQSVFAQLAARNLQCEILCLPNGCTDDTAEIARQVFREMEQSHPYASAIRARVIEIATPGRNNAWNQFVHEFSAAEAQFLYLMDADILFQDTDTIYSLYTALERDPRAGVASGRQVKEIELKARKSLRDRLSIATSEMTGTIAGRFTGQLYCMRATVARNLYVPRDLLANDDGFFKAAICTNFFTEPLDPSRIVTAPNAAHVYEAYLSPREVMNNQKRQMIGQTTVFLLVEHLKSLPLEERKDLANTLRRNEREDPEWLKKIIGRHMQQARVFWQLFPGVLTFRFKRLWKMKGVRKVTHFPAAAVGFGVTMIACARAHRFLNKGENYYWPKASRQSILEAKSN